MDTGVRSHLEGCLASSSIDAENFLIVDISFNVRREPDVQLVYCSLCVINERSVALPMLQ
jgi:hypothetical protein